jgi:hypothetical protein
MIVLEARSGWGIHEMNRVAKSSFFNAPLDE